jgi:hypothetical protein
MHQIDFDIAALLYHRSVIGPITCSLAGYQIQATKGRMREHRLKAFALSEEQSSEQLGHLLDEGSEIR